MMMTYRNRKIEKNVLDFYRTQPPSLLKFPFDIYEAVSSIRTCKIHSYQDYAKKRGTTVDDVISFCESDTGCTHKDVRTGNFIIMYNNSQSIVKERKIFTIAHELGHIVSGHFNIINSKSIAQDYSTNKSLEREANHFAACILCPLPIVHKFQPNSILDIQEFFGLSCEASEIMWDDYKNYDRNYYIQWHNDMIRLFNFI